MGASDRINRSLPSLCDTLGAEIFSLRLRHPAPATPTTRAQVVEALVSSIGTSLVIRWTYSGAAFSPSGDCPRTKSRSKKHANNNMSRTSKKHANTASGASKMQDIQYCLYGELGILGEEIRCLKKNLNASRPSEHPPVRGENVKTFRCGHRLQRQNLFTAYKRVLDVVVPRSNPI